MRSKVAEARKSDGEGEKERGRVYKAWFDILSPMELIS